MTIKKLLLEILGFAFYVYEVYRLFNVTFVIPNDPLGVSYLRAVMIILALPLLYLFRIAYFFDLGGHLSAVLSAIFKFDDKHAFFQVKLFYYAIYACLSFLLLVEVIGRFMK